MNQEAVETLRGIGDRGGTAMTLHNLGLVYFDKGELARSRDAFEEALAIRRQQRDRNNTAQVLAALAAVATEQDRLSEARTLIAESITLREQLGEAISLAQSKLVLAGILLAQGRAAESEKTAQGAAAAFHGAQAPGLEAEAALACAAAQLGRDDVRARASLARAKELLRDSRDARLTIRRDILVARSTESLAQLESARERARRAGFLGLARKAQ
jgi:tetratricopeptide (TPR) repeat protein